MSSHDVQSLLKKILACVALPLLVPAVIFWFMIATDNYDENGFIAQNVVAINAASLSVIVGFWVLTIAYLVMGFVNRDKA